MPFGGGLEILCFFLISSTYSAIGVLRKDINIVSLQFSCMSLSKDINTVSREEHLNSELWKTQDISESGRDSEFLNIQSIGSPKKLCFIPDFIVAKC